MVATLDIDDTRHRLAQACTAIVDANDRLTRADLAIGDGDYGVGMARGFSAALVKLDEKPAESIGDLFKSVGIAILSTCGGASGAVFGTFFMQAASPLDIATMDVSGFIAALQSGLAAVQKRGGAAPGDKTVIDALVLAIEHAQQTPADDVLACLAAAAAGAAAGVEATVPMKAATGKARSLGDRSVGHPDPCAISMAALADDRAGSHYRCSFGCSWRVAASRSMPSATSGFRFAPRHTYSSTAAPLQVRTLLGS